MLSPTNQTSDELPLLLNPYNPTNVKITRDDVLTILTRYGLPPIINNMALYERAFMHDSYTLAAIQKTIATSGQQLSPNTEEALKLSTKSNQTLEFLGDGVLEGITKFIIYSRFPKENEGFASDVKMAIANNEHIGKIAYEMGLHRWLILSKKAEDEKVRTNFKKLGALFESFLGALFLDTNKIKIQDDRFSSVIGSNGLGYQFAFTFIENVFTEHVNWTQIIQSDTNYKKILQIMIQKKFKLTPCYVEHGNNAVDGYTMGVYLCIGQSIHRSSIESAMSFDDFDCSFDNIYEYYKTHPVILVLLATSSHKIKKEAEQMACYKVLQRGTTGDAAHRKPPAPAGLKMSG